MIQCNPVVCLCQQDVCLEQAFVAKFFQLYKCRTQGLHVFIGRCQIYHTAQGFRLLCQTVTILLAGKLLPKSFLVPSNTNRTVRKPREGAVIRSRRAWIPIDLCVTLFVKGYSSGNVDGRMGETGLGR